MSAASETPPSPPPAKAMVFAAGLGTRMRPLSDRMPKPLISVAGKALIDYTLDRLAGAGVKTAIVNVHYLADQIIAHLARRKIPQILISDEREKLLDQGGGIAKALPWLGADPIFLANTDSFFVDGPTDNLRELCAFFDPDRMDFLLLLAAMADSTGIEAGTPGDFNMAPDGRLTRRREREIAPFIYTGIGIVRPGLFDSDPREAFPLSPYFFEAAAKGRLFGRRLDGQWFHVGTPQAIGEAERKFGRV
ncbi:MAG TPA: nucleotidyltransferase family protein [Methylocella sp.]|nr:nucleotidyltransferase family protein [Methylocella sp.]